MDLTAARAVLPAAARAVFGKQIAVAPMVRSDFGAAADPDRPPFSAVAHAVVAAGEDVSPGGRGSGGGWSSRLAGGVGVTIEIDGGAYPAALDVVEGDRVSVTMQTGVVLAYEVARVDRAARLVWSCTRS